MACIHAPYFATKVCPDCTDLVKPMSVEETIRYLEDENYELKKQIARLRYAAERLCPPCKVKLDR